MPLLRSAAKPGLYFLGLDWLYKRSSGLFSGVSDDAVSLAGAMEADQSTMQADGSPPV